MSLSARIHARLSEERGMTLVELLVSVSIGIVVLLATFDLVDASTRASAEVQDRVDAVQRGRVAMEQITQRLRSQTCLPDETVLDERPAVVYGDEDEVRFYTDLVADSAEALGDFSPEARSLRFEDLGGGEGRIVESVWETLADPPSTTFAGPPTRTRVVLASMGRSDEDEPAGQNGEGRAVGDPVPIFRYYTFVGDDPATPSLLLQTPVSDADRQTVVKVALSFDARPTRGPNTRAALDTTFETDVFVRTANPLDPSRSPECL